MGSTSCLLDCCSVACGCRDRCGRNNLCRKSCICVWSLVCWSCCAPFCRPFFSTSAFTSFSSPVLKCWFRVLLHMHIMRSAARSSQDSVLMSSAFMSHCRHPCSAAVGCLWFFFHMPALHIELIVIDGDGWQFHCILPWTLVFLRLIVSPNPCRPERNGPSVPTVPAGCE